VFYGGQVKDDLSVKYRDEVGSRVLHTYQVFNSGPWKVSNLVVNIDWPYQVASHFTPRKWLLYLDEKPYVEGIEIKKLAECNFLIKKMYSLILVKQ